MGLFQPDFIWVTFRSSMTSKYNRTDANIKEAVKDWCDDSVKATIKYGHISEWNTSLVTDMNDLFKDKTDFNDDISKWNVRNVTDMSGIFSGEYGNTGSFNGDISRWNVSSVTNMECMFHRTSFNGDISGWNVSSVTNMSGMFFRTLFYGDISRWNVCSVTDMGFMFWESEFDGTISRWDVCSVTINQMFTNCPIAEEHQPMQRIVNEESIT
jgi:surface protein